MLLKQLFNTERCRRDSSCMRCVEWLLCNATACRAGRGPVYVT